MGPDSAALFLTARGRSRCTEQMFHITSRCAARADGLRCREPGRIRMFLGRMVMDLAAGDPGHESAAEGVTGAPAHGMAALIPAGLDQHTVSSLPANPHPCLQTSASVLSPSSPTSRAASKHNVPFLCYSCLIQPTASCGLQHLAAEGGWCPVLLHFASKSAPFSSCQLPPLQLCRASSRFTLDEVAPQDG